jgi:NitT/TauT family transport system permease protein
MTTPLVEPLPRGLLRRTGSRLTDWLPALAVLILGLGLWELLVRGRDVQAVLLPAPSDIAQTLWDERGVLWTAVYWTFREALAGFAIGSSAAILFAMLLARWPLATAALMPYAIAANAVPIIAFAPITNKWFDPFSMWPQIAIAAIVCFFPVLVNTVRGLRSVRPSSLELMRSYAAGEVEVFRRVRFPTALPYIFSGLKVATVLAMIAATVGDYFGTHPESLGTKIRQWQGTAAFTDAWAGIALMSMLGILFYATIALAERLTMSWHPSMRGGRE